MPCNRSPALLLLALETHPQWGTETSLDRQLEVTLLCMSKCPRAWVWCQGLKPCLSVRDDGWILEKEKVSGLLGLGHSRSLTPSHPNPTAWLQTKPWGSYWMNWCCSWSSNTLAIGYEEPTHWKRLWCWERLKAKGERGSRGWDG